jgi:hypothetical protein
MECCGDFLDKEKHMDQVDAIMALESGELNDEQIVALFQDLIDSGLAWRLQGSYGRMAKRLIDDGYCHPAKGEK